MFHLFTRRLVVAAVCLSSLVCTSHAEPRASASAKTGWFKGNLHTHTFWSDGDNFPELIAEWYKTNGYDFLAFSDHNNIQDGEKWISVAPTNTNRKLAYEAYIKRFGKDSLQTKSENGETL